MDTKLFQLNKSSSIRCALGLIEKNTFGLVFLINNSDQVIASVSDGDIRRYLLENGSIDDPVMNCSNNDYRWARENTSREKIIKLLENNIKVIPIIDNNKKLIEIVTRKNLPIQSEAHYFVRSRSPARISFGGGGSDLSAYFNNNNMGSVLNCTISIYSHATMKKRKDDKIIINSADLGATLEANSIHEVTNIDPQFSLITSLLSIIKPDFGLELNIHSDFPIGSGLGGSAVVLSSIIGCFNEYRRNKWNEYEMAELAYQAERLNCDIAGGWQDQYATIFGGFNFMEFKTEQNLVHPLKINQNTILELEASLVLMSTGLWHESGEILKDQKEKLNNENIKMKIKDGVDLSREMRDQLLKGNVKEFGSLLDKGWQNKKNFSSKITSNKLNEIYELAISHGAKGGKLLGAGGGGFFVFFVNPAEKNKFVKSMTENNFEITPFVFDHHGLQSWSIRENDS